jgi:hypothetical protein
MKKKIFFPVIFLVILIEEMGIISGIADNTTAAKTPAKGNSLMPGSNPQQSGQS